MVYNVIIPAALYVLPKIGEYLTQHPATVDPNCRFDDTVVGRINRIRGRIANYYASFANHFGRRMLQEHRCLIIDNLWLSSLLIVSIMRNETNVPFSRMFEAGSCVISLSVAICIFRLMLSRAGSGYFDFMAPRFPVEYKWAPFPDEPPALQALIEKDYVLNRFICPITFRPIRVVVEDHKTNQLYEQGAIERWLGEKKTCPLTRRPLEFSELKEAPVLQAIISERIEYLKTQIRS